MEDWCRVCACAELLPGEYRSIDCDDTPIAVFNVDGEIYALEDVCSHDGEQLTGGPLEYDQIVCPRHGARFCVKDGEALTAPAYEPVAKFPVRVENGKIYVRDDRWD